MLLLACNTEPLRCMLRAQCHVYYDVFAHKSTVVICSDAKSYPFILASKILIGRPVESFYNRDFRLIENHTCVSERGTEADASNPMRYAHWLWIRYIYIYINIFFNYMLVHALNLISRMHSTNSLDVASDISTRFNTFLFIISTIS